MLHKIQAPDILNVAKWPLGAKTPWTLTLVVTTKILEFGGRTKVYVRNPLEPSSGILHGYHLTRGSMLTSQDYNPSLVVYVPEPIRAI